MIQFVSNFLTELAWTPHTGIVRVSLQEVSLQVVWNHCLNNPPWTGDPIVDTNLTVFRDYFVGQWLPNREKSLLWNHFHRDGPRTTNNAEAYHGGLRSAFNTRRKAPLGVFLGKLKQLHQDIRCRVKLLQQGSPPNQRSVQYINNDKTSV